MRALVLATALLLSASACADVAGLDRFQKRAVAESASTGVEFFSLRTTFIGMRPHVGQLVEYRVVDGNNFVQSRGVIKAIPMSGDVTLLAKRAIPRVNGPYRLDFYADVNFSGGFDGIGSVIANDHAWRMDPLVDNAKLQQLRADDLVEVKFTHSTSFTNIDHYPSGTKNPANDTGLGAAIHVVGLDEFIGKMLQARITEHLTQHVVGLYRTVRIDTPVVDAVVPGCVDLDTEYDVDVYIDANGNESYDNPASEGGDRGFILSATSAVNGLDLTLDVRSPGAGDGKVDVGEP